MKKLSLFLLSSLVILFLAKSGLLAQATGLGPPLGPPDNTDPLNGVRGGIPGGVLPTAPPLPAAVREMGNGRFTITDSRPIEVAAQLLTRKLGVPIAFEEAAWISSSDVIRAANYPGNQGVTSRTNPKGPLVPKGGTVDVVVPPGPPSDRAASASRTIEAVLISHRNHGNPGEFKLVRFGQDEYSIVADRAGDATGNMVKQTSPLDAKISFPEADRSLHETIETICEAVRTSSHLPLVNLSPLNQYFDQTRLRIGATNETARDVLAKALRRPGGSKRTWTLRFDPENKTYLISLLGVQAEIAVAGGKVALQPMTWPK